MKDPIIGELLAYLSMKFQSSKWNVQLEVERPELLAEFGSGQASSIDVLLLSSTSAICIESKFLSDARPVLVNAVKLKKRTVRDTLALALI